MKTLLQILLVLAAAIGAETATAQSWLVGKQTPVLATGTNNAIVGDGVTNARGGEAPYLEGAGGAEPVDIPTNSTIRTNWTFAGAGQFDAYPTGDEAKARFDCSDTFSEQNDSILAPGINGGAPHDHTFSGNTWAQGNAHNATYANLRANGYSTCFGGPMNRTLYWEPTLFIKKNGMWVKLRPVNIITYYLIDHAAPTKFTRWPRNIAMISGYNTADPSDTYTKNMIAAAGGRYSYVGNGHTLENAQSGGWRCIVKKAGNPSGRTATAPWPGEWQPYLVDALGRPTLDCDDSQPTSGIETGAGTQPCWDGKNPRSPDGRQHMMHAVYDNVKGKTACPEGWYWTVRFEAKVTFNLKSSELASGGEALVHLSSDRMNASSTPGDPSSPSSCRQVSAYFCPGETFHFDLIPAWDYGTADNPGFMIKFFKSIGVTSYLKTTAGVCCTTLAGDSPTHEMGYGRIDATTNTSVDGAPPAADPTGPNPVVLPVATCGDSPSTCPYRIGTGRYYPLTSGTQATGVVFHSH
jgi:hypothetical protein